MDTQMTQVASTLLTTLLPYLFVAPREESEKMMEAMRALQNAKEALERQIQVSQTGQAIEPTTAAATILTFDAAMSDFSACMEAVFERMKTPKEQRDLWRQKVSGTLETLFAPMRAQLAAIIADTKLRG